MSKAHIAGRVLLKVPFRSFCLKRGSGGQVTSLPSGGSTIASGVVTVPHRQGGGGRPPASPRLCLLPRVGAWKATSGLSQPRASRVCGGHRGAGPRGVQRGGHSVLSAAPRVPRRGWTALSTAGEAGVGAGRAAAAAAPGPGAALTAVSPGSTAWWSVPQALPRACEFSSAAAPSAPNELFPA